MQPYQMNRMAPYYGNYYGVPYPYGTMAYGQPQYYPPMQRTDISPRRTNVNAHQYPYYPTEQQYNTHGHYHHRPHHDHHRHYHRQHSHDKHHHHDSSRESANRKPRYVRNNASQTTPTLMLDMIQSGDQNDRQVVTPVFMRDDLNPKAQPQRLTPEFLQGDLSDSISEYSTDDDSRYGSAQIIDPYRKRGKFDDLSPYSPATKVSKTKSLPMRPNENDIARGLKTKR